MQLQTGDLIFVGVTDTDDFSQRIAASTHRETAVDYTHIGLVEKTTATLFVLHASPETGSTREPLARFLNRQTGVADVYRPTISNAPWPAILQNAKAMLGQPYNWSFIKSRPGYYCSEYIMNAFQPAQIFTEAPMTFGPNNSILPGWLDYYADLGLPVPNGEPGTNPNGLANSPHLKYLGRLNDVNAVDAW